MNNRKQWFGLILSLIVCMIGVSAPFQHYAAFPSELRMFSGQQTKLDYAMPVHARLSLTHPELVKINGSAQQHVDVDMNQPISLEPLQSGQGKMTLKLFGSIPVKTVHVQVMPELRVIPGGQTIGVKVKSAGIMVVGHHQVATASDHKTSPGEEADVKLGDLIVDINGQHINEVSKVASIVEQAGKAKAPLKLRIKRNNQMIERSITPAFDTEDQAWRLGLYIRDSAAGVGTLTFYAPTQGVYGALGHVITDMDTQTAIEVEDGQVLQSSVTSINKSQHGEPGEKRAHFLKEGKVLGNVVRNTPFGIFGDMKSTPTHGYSNKPIPVAFAEEVKEGPAEILTVIGGQKVEKFQIEIVHVTKQTSPATKGMVIKITDKRLIDHTGGIVQGMSGSPILQNGKLVGAVTHVFVNDPTSGYGCFIEWMLQDAGVLVKRKDSDLKAG